LLLAAVASFVLAAVFIFVVPAIVGIPIVATPAAILGRLLSIASVVLVVLAAVRKLDTR
jgi:hypothetical protein